MYTLRVVLFYLLLSVSHHLTVVATEATTSSPHQGASTSSEEIPPLQRYQFQPHDVAKQLAEMAEEDSNPRQQVRLRPETPFPCRLSPSAVPPERVDRLRPGDIRLVAAMGDSLIAGNGAGEDSALGAFVENRGVSWTAGGDGDWRSTLTLPNILKEMSPNLTGYSEGKAQFLTPVSALNVAFPISATRDALSQAKTLVARMKRLLGKEAYQTDWKVVTLLFGANDICSGQCYDATGSSPTGHSEQLRAALDYLQLHMPRAFVNLVPVLDVTVSVRVKRSMVCRMLHRLFCSCYHRVSDPAQKFARLARLYQKHEELLISSGRYNTKPDFTVVIQPFMKAFNMPRSKKLQNQEVIGSNFITYDCFHFSQRGHALAANMLWNNMLEPVGSKSTYKMVEPWERFYCPTEENPYLFTLNNSLAFYMTGRQDGLE